MLLLLAAPASAQGMPQGCWARDYDAAHLAANPDQVVRAMRLSFGKDPENGPVAWLEVTLADQGHAGREGLGGVLLQQGLLCRADGGRPTCVVECDGGSFEVVAQAGGQIDIRTRYLLLGIDDECGGPVDLAELPDTPVTYRLFRAPDSACDLP
ncbi:MAG: hypothetical protein MUF73_05645 [Rhodobacteraceae bacterium]|jgi:hypothetical protein|nr:hypothetical protein [Paracoccaceae bacterium]